MKLTKFLVNVGAGILRERLGPNTAQFRGALPWNGCVLARDVAKGRGEAAAAPSRAFRSSVFRVMVKWHGILLCVVCVLRVLRLVRLVA